MALVRRVLGIAAVVVLALAIFGGGWLVGRLGIGSVVDPASLTDVERQFAERMRDVTLVGSFTVAGREDRAPRPDRYDISASRRSGTASGGSTPRWIAAASTAPRFRSSCRCAGAATRR